MFNNWNNLEQTTLWKCYAEKHPSQTRSQWVRDMYGMAIDKLRSIQETFPNYTLHDEVHVINVLDAMAGILGEWTEKLSMEECEVLILVAALHDVGMSYTRKDIEDAAANVRWLGDFLQKRSSEYIGSKYADLPESLQQDYLRSLHHKRVHDVLNDTGCKWASKPAEIKIPLKVLSTVCRAHGEDRDFLDKCEELEYIEAYRADLRFCALLLRLGDILDFDGSRAPQILYPFAENDPVSSMEYKKHASSKGFDYPLKATVKELTFAAECEEPDVEDKLRRYLDWVDEELTIFGSAKSSCHESWQREFPLPYRVDRKGIHRKNYDGGEFRITMDQSQILTLLTGENLYNSNDIFIRELLQNAIDATLLRGKMDPYFRVNSEEAAICLWEWHDSEGRLFFRIDDNGTGMTRGMLMRYFLKVGNSYYNSPELKNDLERTGCKDGYRANSRFGIGFLSSFLCADRAEISTLYCDDRKSRSECNVSVDDGRGYGLRMDLPGLEGYYTLRNQAAGHRTKGNLQCRDIPCDITPPGEHGGYRTSPGTSIVLQIDPGKLGAVDLRGTVEKWIIGPRMPIYYNGNKIGRTYDEILSSVRPMVGEKTYEISEEEKEQFDRNYPQIKGNYPKIKIRTTILDDLMDDLKIPGFGGIAIAYDVIFPEPAVWSILDQKYHLEFQSIQSEEFASILLSPCNENSRGYTPSFMRGEVDKLFLVFEKYSQCPKDCSGFETAWEPISKYMSLENAWRSFVDSKNPDMELKLPYNTTLKEITQKADAGDKYLVYRSVACYTNRSTRCNLLFYCEDDFRPTMDVSRSNVSKVPPLLGLLIGTIQRNCLRYDKFGSIEGEYDLGSEPLCVWRELINGPYGHWFEDELRTEFEKFLSGLKDPIPMSDLSSFIFIDNNTTSLYCRAYVQEKFRIQISYTDGQILTFEANDEQLGKTVYDIFPPMVFCKAADDLNRKFLCCDIQHLRRGITEDHAFTQWLFKNGEELQIHYPRQFEQITTALLQRNGEDIISTVNRIREQFKKWGSKKIDVESMPELSEEDFWNPERFLEGQ